MTKYANTALITTRSLYNLNTGRPMQEDQNRTGDEAAAYLDKLHKDYNTWNEQRAALAELLTKHSPHFAQMNKAVSLKT